MQTALALPDFQFLDRQRRKLRRVMDTSLGDLDDRLRDHFRLRQLERSSAALWCLFFTILSMRATTPTPEHDWSPKACARLDAFDQSQEQEASKRSVGSDQV